MQPGVHCGQFTRVSGIASRITILPRLRNIAVTLSGSGVEGDAGAPPVNTANAVFRWIAEMLVVDADPAQLSVKLEADSRSGYESCAGSPAMPLTRRDRR
jgi:hypothetical protein